MDDRELLRRVLAAKSDFGVKCSKYAGSVTVEAIREGLREAGILTSRADVFIRGLPIELDLLVPRSTAEFEEALLYRAEDVMAVIEVKNSGSFGADTIGRVRDSFERVLKHALQARCLYVTLAERKGYKWAVTRENLGAPAYTLFWHTSSTKHRHYEPTGDWVRLIEDLKAIVHSSERPGAY